MPPKTNDGERLLLLTLILEAAVESENWVEVSRILDARATILDCLSPITPNTVSEISAAEERMLDCLRKRLGGVRADLRNLTAALRITTPYSQEQSESALSLAG
jgi:hypothetical protein